MEANKFTLKTLAISIAVVLAMETVFRLTLAGQTVSPLLALGITRCIEAVLLVFIANRFEKDPNAIGLSKSKLYPGLKRGLVWSAGFGIAAGILFAVLLAAGINPLKLVHTPLPSAPRQIILFYLVGGVIGPVWEEIFFRGFIFGFFRRWGLYTAILISTALFVLPHYDGSHLPLTQIVGGIVFAIAYEKEKSLIVPVTIHCLGNIAIFSLTFLS
ncbi:MAG: CPBP family intramembrane glutamic endopeptidase [Desulfobacteraceae bacterium]|jgi:membrane protease YdiL (CAAX protease family)|nr:CPBP family intramembrane glutamic endopeptidase [Desulfobacteraceae bacterium]